MDLDAQLQTLIADGPSQGVPLAVMEGAIAPALSQLAARLKHLTYYMLQDFDDRWVAVTLTNRNQPQQRKRVIYGFSTAKDAGVFHQANDPQLFAIAVPVTHILFRLFALKTIDSAIFFETPGDLNAGVEIRQTDLQQLIEQSLTQLQPSPSPQPKIPPNLA